MTDAKRIAEGLTDVQRELLKNLVALEDAGLIERVPSRRLFVKPTLTNLGRAVAAELEGE